MKHGDNVNNVNNDNNDNNTLDKFTNETVMLPKVTPIEPPPKVEESPIARKLKELEGLFNQKLITQEEYETKRKEILSNM